MTVKSLCMQARGVLLFCLFAVPSLSFAANVNGVFRVVKGQVMVKSHQTGQTTRARLGAKVYPQDIIITSKNSRAKIVMIDHNEINVLPDSHVELKSYQYNPAKHEKNVLLKVLYGKVRAKVQQKYDGRTSRFQVRTPSAVAGVRGTDFLTGYDQMNHRSNVVTFRGTVAFGTPGPQGTVANQVFITKGFMAEITPGHIPSQPTAVPHDQLAKIDHESNAESHDSVDHRQPADSSENHKKSDDKKDDGSKAAPAPTKGDDGKSAASGDTSANADSHREPASTGADQSLPPPPEATGAAPVGPIAPPAPTPGPISAPLQPNHSNLDTFINNTIKQQSHVILHVHTGGTDAQP